MKKLIISFKPASQALDEITQRLKIAESKKGKVEPHYEISFTELKDYKKFVAYIENMDM